MIVLSYFLYISIGLICAYLVNPKKCQPINSVIHKTTHYGLRLFVAFVLLVILGTFRDASVGKDNSYYIMIFNTYGARATSLVENPYFSSEPAFALLMYVSSWLSADYTLFFFLMSCIESFAFIYFCKCFIEKNTPYWFVFSIFILEYIYYFSAARTGLSVACCLISYCALKHGKIFKTFLFSAIGVLFHSSALISLLFIVFVMIDRRFSDKERNWRFILLMVGSMVLSTLAVKVLVEFWRADKYFQYLAMEGSIWGHLPKILMVLFVFCMYSFENRKGKHDYNSVELLGTYFTALIIPAVVAYNISRIMNFYLCLRLSTYSKTLSASERFVEPRLIRLLSFFAVIAWLVFRLYGLTEQAGVLPYIFKK